MFISSMFQVSLNWKHLDMGTILTIRVEEGNQDYYLEYWVDSNIKGDSIMLYSADGPQGYLHVKDYLLKNNFDDKNISVYSNFRLFNANKYLSISGEDDLWPIYSNPTNLNAAQLIQRSSKVRIELTLPFQGQYVTPSLSNYDWEWLTEENYVEYFNIQIGPDHFCNAILYGPKGKYPLRTIEKIESDLVEKGGNIDTEYLEYLMQIYDDYDFIVTGYCSC